MKVGLFCCAVALLPLIPGSGFEKVKTVTVTGQYISLDNRNNLYVMNKDELLQYSTEGELKQQYSNKTLGTITSVDLYNPLKPLLFYKDFSKIVYLDNFMAQNGELIRLDELGMEQVSAVAASHENGIWVYDQENIAIKRLDSKLKVSHQTGNLLQVIGMELQPNLMRQYENTLYVNDPDKGILLFDIYGTYSKTIPIKELESFQVVEKNIIYTTGDTLYAYNMVTLSEQKTALPEQGSTMSKVFKDKLFVISKNALTVYKKKP